MKIDTLMPADAPGAIAERAQRFEAQGFDCVWTFEAANDAFLPLSHVAAATQRLEIGTNIAVAFARSPFAMAQVAWDLQRYSEGRFHLGIGTQVRVHVERRFSMPFEHPAARVTDYIRCVRAIWDTFQNGTRPSYEGPFYQFKLINAFFDPGPIDDPDIPIYLAGVNPRMCRAAGEVADGFHVHPMHSAPYLQDVVKPALAEGASKGGKVADELVLYAPVFVITGNTQYEMDRMEQTVRQQISFYGSTPSYHAVLEYHGHEGLGKKLNGLLREGKMAEMGAAIPESLIDHIAVAAKPGEVGTKIRERYDGILDRVSLYMAMDEAGGFDDWDGLIGVVHAA